MKSKTAAVLLVLSLASCENMESSNQTQRKMARFYLEQQRQRDAELIAERNGAPIAPSDYKRLTAAIAFKREKEETELAQYAKFQMEQKIAFAQASNPRMLITNGDEVPTDYRQVEYGGGRPHRELSLTRHQGFAGAGYSVVQGASSGQERSYPARFYKRQLQENSADQAQADYNANLMAAGQQTNPEDVPYAVPVPGRPGYVTMPPKMGGYIDVRGYAPGSMVMDPWTKTIIRVP